MIYNVEFVYPDDFTVCGTAFLASTLEKAIEWIKQYGKEWADDANGCFYTIVGQEVDGSADEFESFGMFDLKGNEINA